MQLEKVLSWIYKQIVQISCKPVISTFSIKQCSQTEFYPMQCLNMITMQRENKYAVDSTYVFGDEMKQAFK